MIRPLDLSARDLAALASGGADARVMGILLAGQLSRRMLLLEAVREAAAATPAGDAVDRAFEMLAVIQRDHPRVVRDVLTLPATGMWATACLRTPDDNGYRHLSSFAATAALRAECDAEIDVPVWQGRVVLPGLGSAFVGPGSRHVRVRSSAAGGTIAVPGAAPIVVHPGSPRWRPFPRLTGGDGAADPRVWLDDAGPYRGLPAARLAPPASGEQVDRWRRLLAAAWRILSRRHTEHATAMAPALRVITPLLAERAGAHLSVTVADGFGAVLLTEPTDAESLALTLVHEFQHGKLAAVHHITPLYVTDTRPVWYCRWKDDPRPLGALLHGAYAHLGIVGFWHGVLRSGQTDSAERALEEFAYWRDGVAEALTRLTRSGGLTGAGHVFTDGMAAALGRLTSQTPVTDAARRAAADRARRHRLGWHTRHGNEPEIT